MHILALEPVTHGALGPLYTNREIQGRWAASHTVQILSFNFDNQIAHFLQLRKPRLSGIKLIEKSKRTREAGGSEPTSLPPRFQDHMQKRLGRHHGGDWASGRKKEAHASGTEAQSGLASDG